MVLCTFCPLIIPFLALSGITGIHPVRAPVSSSVDVVLMRSPDGSGSIQHYANPFRSRSEVTSLSGYQAVDRTYRLRTKWRQMSAQRE
jgi:hypothetical protein